MTRSRKRGHFPQNSDFELDIPADTTRSAKSAVHARENHLTLARHVPKLQSFEFHARVYLGFEIFAFFSVLYIAKCLRILLEVDTRVQCLAGYYSITGRLPMATAVHLVSLSTRSGTCSGRIAIYRAYTGGR